MAEGKNMVLGESGLYYYETYSLSAAIQICWVRDAAVLLHCNWLMSDGKDGESSSQHRNLVYKQLGCLLGCVNLGKAVKREGQH